MRRGGGGGGGGAGGGGPGGMCPSNQPDSAPTTRAMPVHAVLG